MAKKSKIAELVVGFVTKGAGGVLASLKAVTASVAAAARSTAGVLGAGLFTGFLVGAASGTVEGEQFANALRILALTVANDLAPALRIAVATALSLIDRYRNLDQGTKDVIATVGVAAAGFAGLTAAATLLGPVISITTTLIGGLSTALVFLATNPVGLTVTAIAGVVTAMVLMSDTADALADRFRPVFRFLLESWYGIKASVSYTLQTIYNGLHNIYQVVENLATGERWDFGLRDADFGWDDIKRDFEENLRAVPEQADRAARATAERLMKIKEMVKNLGSGKGGGAGFSVPGLDDIKKLYDQARNPLRVKVNVSFESNQQVYESIQKALLEQQATDPRLDQNLNDIKDRLDKIIGNTGKQARAAVVGP